MTLFANNPDHEAALDWAASLVLRVETISKAELQADWESEAAKRHRAVLKADGPQTLSQLLGYVKARLAALSEPAAA